MPRGRKREQMMYERGGYAKRRRKRLAGERATRRATRAEEQDDRLRRFLGMP
jgi:hypothetical protein